MKNFALIGVGGFVAVRHLKAIKETGNNLIAALDKNDSVGVLDSYFPNADFFVEFERFDRHIDKLKRKSIPVDYISICTPNYLHDSHIRFALRQGAQAICEKPLVINPWNLDGLEELQKESGIKINTILQLRLHPAIIELKRKIEQDTSGKVYDIDLTYITSRGHWYFASWKAQEDKSGGIATNIGVHFFDMLAWIFGKVKENVVHVLEPASAAGLLTLDKARVRWFLSVDQGTLPDNIKLKGQRTFRSIAIDGTELEFSEGFTDLHTLSYKEILDGHGYSIDDVRVCIQTVHDIRNSRPIGLTGNYHPFASKAVVHHPFRK
jgi:UDP-N-acetyl-2-amino-2-deoxyglucuronate dehydrogenase